MTDLEVNKIIAEYMGSDMRIDESRPGKLKDALGRDAGYVFTKSLDSLIPVWEKLNCCPDISYDYGSSGDVKIYFCELSENDDKTKIVKDIMKSYVNNNMATMGEYFHPEAEISVNDAVMTYDEMVVAFASGHENFDNILHSNVIATTMFYNNGRVYTNSWYDWSGTSKKRKQFKKH